MLCFIIKQISNFENKMNNNPQLAKILSLSPIIPVLVLDDIELAKPLAKTLVAAGLPVIEVTLRSNNALEIIKQMAQIKGAIIGSGTVRNIEQMRQSIDAGCQFMVSPGAPKKLLEQALNFDIPLLPGIATSSEIMQASEMGYKYLKFFPAKALGGVQMLKNFASPFPDIKFCPTGGIGAGDVRSYLELPNVICVGGSFITPKEALEQKDFEKIKNIAQKSLTQF